MGSNGFKDGRVILLDGSALSNAHDSLSKQLYVGDKGFRDVDTNEVREDINLLSKIREIDGLSSIIEVKTEVENAVRILNQQIEYHQSGVGKKVCRENRRRVKRHNGSFDASNEECEGFQIVKAYVTGLFKTIKHVEGFINSEFYFDGQREDIYNQSLRLVNDMREIKSNYHKPYKNPTSKPGVILNTDNKLIATSIAFSFDFPVVLLTRDLGLESKLRRVQGKIKGHKYDVHYMDANAFFCLEDKKLELV